jgi:hypothetical protein
LRISSFAKGACVGERVASFSTGCNVGFGLIVGALVPENGEPLGDAIPSFAGDGGGSFILPQQGTLLKQSSPSGQLVENSVHLI